MTLTARLQGALGIALLILGLAAFAVPTAAQGRPKVVVSFSILADLVSVIGGDRVEVTALIGPGGDSHTFEPTPADARAIAEAELVVINGLNFEEWINGLIVSAGFAGPVVVASDGIVLLALADEAHDHEEDEHGDEEHEDEHEEDEHGDEEHEDENGHEHDHGEFDPHAWQDVANVRVYVENIALALTALDPGGAEQFATNLSAYLAALAIVEAEIVEAVAALPRDGRTIVTSHDAFGYLGAAYGLRFLAPQGVNPEALPGAGEVATLIDQIRSEGIDAVFVEALTDPRIVEQIARETGAVIGGALYSDTLSDRNGPAGTYIEMMRHNLRTIVGALNG